jgi:ferredoxin-NADP reductase
MNIPFVDAFLNRITMYRLALYYTVLLIAVGFVYAFFNLVSFSPWDLLYSFAVITAVCWVANEALARVWKITPNTESVYITAFILVLIVNPVSITNIHGAVMLAIASALAMASKFVLVLGNRHIFNPAALGVAVIGIVFGTYASWWVAGNLALLPWVLVGGLLVVRKIQRFDLFWSFLIVAAAGVCISFLPFSPLATLQDFIVHSSAIFLACIMLTEPFTTPPTRMHRMLYGAIVGFLFIPDLHIGGFYTSPEIALLVGNVYSYIVSPKSRRILTLKEAKQIAHDVYEFVFVPDRPLAFRPGQYLEWTLGHKKADQRGNRRYFTIASSPTEHELRLGMKSYTPASTFKQALLKLEPGQTLTVAQLAGEFTLPKNTNQKLVFIAGGIGITPFRAMAQYMLDRGERRDSILLYSTKTPEEVAYKDVFEKAGEVGLRAHYLQMIDKDTLMREVPDYRERMFYLSGPRGMVVTFEKTLKSLGVPRHKIKIDFFPGFV